MSYFHPIVLTSQVLLEENQEMLNRLILKNQFLIYIFLLCNFFHAFEPSQNASGSWLLYLLVSCISFYLKMRRGLKLQLHDAFIGYNFIQTR